MPVSVRDFQDGDSDQFLAVVRDLQTFESGLYDRMLPVEDIGEWYIKALQERCAAEGGSILVAEDGGRVVGYATIFASVEQTAELDEAAFTYGFVSHIAVSADARGQGIGKTLMAECEARARVAGRQWLRIIVFANNTNARAMYERLGFHDLLLTMEKPLA